MNDNNINNPSPPGTSPTPQAQSPTHSFYDQNPVNLPNPAPQPLASTQPLPPVQAVSSPPPIPSPVPFPAQSDRSPLSFPQVAPVTPSPPMPPPGPPPWLKIVKIAGGIIGVILLLLFFFRLVLPFFSKPKEKNVVLTYWGLWEDAGIMNQVLANFQQENPRIKVNYQKQDIKDYRDRVMTRIQNGTGPDIFMYHNTWLPLFARMLTPLSSDVLTASEFKKAYYPVIQKDVVRNGAIFGLPLSIDTLSLFINTQALQAGGQQVPKDWNEFIKVSNALTVKEQDGKIKTAGAALGSYDNITHAPDIISLIMLQNGTDLYNLTNTSKAASEALDFYTSFVKSGSNVWDETLDPSIIAFAKGNLVMYFGYSWDIFTIQALNPKLVFSTNPVPNLPGKNLTIASYWVNGVSASGKNQKEALLLMRYLARKDVQQKFYTETAKTRLFGEPYARMDLGQLLKDNKLVFPFVSQAQFAESSFFASDTYDNALNGVLNVYLGNAVRSMLGNTSSETAVKTLSQGVEQVLKRYGR